MQANRGDSSDALFTEINVTPLVDVMLVLLVVFIITAPLIVPQNMKVNLPKTESNKLESKIKDGQLVINKDGTRDPRPDVCPRVHNRGEPSGGSALRVT